MKKRGMRRTLASLLVLAMLATSGITALAEDLQKTGEEMDAVYYLVNQDGGGAEMAITPDTREVITWTREGNPDHWWTLKEIEPEVYQIRNLDSKYAGQVLGASGDAVDAKMVMQAAAQDDQANLQKWVLEEAEGAEGSYRLKNAATGLYMMKKKLDGQWLDNVVLAAKDEANAAQIWKLEKTGHYIIETSINNGIITPASGIVDENASQEFQVIPEVGYVVKEVTVNGTSLEFLESENETITFTAENITKNLDVRITTEPNTAEPEQTFPYKYYVVNGAGDELVIDEGGNGGMNAGNGAIIWAREEKADHWWKFYEKEEGKFQIINDNSKLVLGVKGEGENAVIWQVEANKADPTQIWEAEPAAGKKDTYYIKNTATGFYMMKKKLDGSPSWRIDVVQAAKADDPAQEWKLENTDGWEEEPVTDKTEYFIHNKAEEVIIGIWQGSSATGASVVKWVNSDSDDQKWYKIPMDTEGEYKFRNIKTGKTMEASGDRVVQKLSANTDAQIWIAENPDSEGYGRLKNKANGMYLSLNYNEAPYEQEIDEYYLALTEISEDAKQFWKIEDSRAGLPKEGDDWIVSVPDNDYPGRNQCLSPRVVEDDYGYLYCTYESGARSEADHKEFVFPIYESQDKGKTWLRVGEIVNDDTIHPDEVIEGKECVWQMSNCPQLFVLPEAMGNLEKGTLICAGNAVAIEKDALKVSDTEGGLYKTSMDLYYSTDGGRNWDYISTIAKGGVNVVEHDPVWEPFFVYYDSQLICYYSDETDPDHSQKLVHKITKDGKKWSDAVEDVAFEDSKARPGMPVVTQLENEKWLYVYEGVGTSSPLSSFYKISDDPYNWNPEDPGIYLWTGGSPYVITLDDGRIAANTGATSEILINTSNDGTGAWIPYETGAPAGYNRCLYQLSSGELLINGSLGFQAKNNFVYVKSLDADKDLKDDVEKTQYISNKENKKVISVWGGSSSDGAYAAAWENAASLDQMWIPLRKEEKSFILKNYKSGKVLAVQDNIDRSIVIQTEEKAGDETQLWKAEIREDGYWALRNEKSGMYLSLNGSTGTNPDAMEEHVLIQVKEYKGDAQLWKFSSVTTKGKDYEPEGVEPPKPVYISIEDAKVTGVQETYEYTGEAIVPVIKVALDEKILREDEDYTAAYKNNVEAGTATIEITGKGEYEGNIIISFEIIKTAEPLPFTDVTEDDWYCGHVEFVYNEGIMTGLSEDVFGPDQLLSRGQFAVILYRMEGEPFSEYGKVFPDVEEETFYAKAAVWAYENDIMTGYGHNRHFGPADEITREQMAVVMYRYAKYRKYDISQKADLDQYKDADQISGFAMDAMQWCVEKELICGMDEEYLAPQGTASRAQCAAIIERFLTEFK